MFVNLSLPTQLHKSCHFALSEIPRVVKVGLELPSKYNVNAWTDGAIARVYAYELKYLLKPQLVLLIAFANSKCVFSRSTYYEFMHTDRSKCIYFQVKSIYFVLCIWACSAMDFEGNKTSIKNVSMLVKTLETLKKQYDNVVEINY